METLKPLLPSEINKIWKFSQLLVCSFCLRRWSAVLEALISHGTLVGEGKDKDMFDGKRKKVCFISITLYRGVSLV